MPRHRALVADNIESLREHGFEIEEFGEGAFFTMTVTDGTGRFEGAIGALEADLERSTFPFSDDPLFLEKATFPVVLEGELILPRPGRGN